MRSLRLKQKISLLIKHELLAFDLNKGLGWQQSRLEKSTKGQWHSAHETQNYLFRLKPGPYHLQKLSLLGKLLFSKLLCIECMHEKEWMK